MRWTKGQLLSPASVLASARAAKAALAQAAAADATLDYLAADAHATGFGPVTPHDSARASAQDDAQAAARGSTDSAAAAAARWSQAFGAVEGGPPLKWEQAADDLGDASNPVPTERAEYVNRVLAECDRHHGKRALLGEKSTRPSCVLAWASLRLHCQQHTTRT